jgi:hypothetical protein
LAADLNPYICGRNTWHSQSRSTASIVNIGSIAGLHAHHALAYTVST